MLGLNEILLIVGAIALVTLFGRKTIKKLATDFFHIKKDIEEVRQEINNKTEATK